MISCIWSINCVALYVASVILCTLGKGEEYKISEVPTAGDEQQCNSEPSLHRVK